MYIVHEWLMETEPSVEKWQQNGKSQVNADNRLHQNVKFQDKTDYIVLTRSLIHSNVNARTHTHKEVNIMI